MKKILNVLLLLTVLLLPVRVLAAGSINVSTRQMNLKKGGAGSFSVVASNAVGKVTVTSSNPSVASVSISEFFLDNNSQVVNVTGNASGNATITVITADAATYDEEVINSTFTINVNVTEPTPNVPVTPPSVPTTPTKPTTPTVPTKPTVPTTPAVVKSNNNNLDRIMVNGLEATKNGETYEIEFSNYVEKVNIIGHAKDNRAVVNAVGEKNINVGDNNFSVIVTAENGANATYWLNVKRSEYNKLKDLPEMLNTIDNIVIKFNSDEKLTKADLEKITNSGKKVTLNKYNDKTLLYSWVLDGKKIKDVSNFNPNIETKVNEKIAKALNYAEGLYLDFTSCGNIPLGSVLKFNISSKYQKDDVVNIYIYEPKNNTMNYILKDNKINSEFLEFGDIETKRYFISKAAFNVKDYDLSEKSLGAMVVEDKNSIVPIVLSGIFGLCTLGLIAYIIILKNKRKIVVSDVDVLDTGDVGIPLEIKEERSEKVEHLSDIPSNNEEPKKEPRPALSRATVVLNNNKELDDFAKTISLELNNTHRENNNFANKEDHRDVRPLNSKY